MKYVYVLLTKTGTVPARIIHLFVGGRFTHASLSLIPATNEFYSYARRKLNNPFCAGLLVENIHTFVYARYPDCRCAVYALPVSDEAYEKLEGVIREHLDHYDRCRYNFLGMIPARMGFAIRRKYRFTCSQFVAMCLERANAVSLPKDPYLMFPNDFPKLSGAILVYEGKLKDCIIPAELPAPLRDA